MRKAIATVSMSGTLRDKLEAIAAAGFDAVELFEPDFIAYRGSAGDVRRIVSDLGLAIDLYQPLRDFEGLPAAGVRRALDRAERKFDVMQALGAPLLLVCSNVSPESVDSPAQAADQLHALAERAHARELRIGYEALAWGRWVNRYRQAWDIVSRADHPSLGLILDSFHTLSLGDDPAGIRQVPGDRIFFVQMADAPILGMDVLQWARHHRNFPGQGQFALAAFLEDVLLAGYQGTLSLEIFNDIFRATPNRRTATDAMRSLIFLESQVRARLGRRSAEPARDARRERVLETVVLADPPPAPDLLGFAFVEFAVDDRAERALGEWLERLGFTCVGRHRSKAVTLYRQGEIHFVLNAEPASEARARFDEQGVSVCVVGLVAADPAHAARRGTALLSIRRDAPRQAQELELPTLIAPGGTIVQFVGPHQDVEQDFVDRAGGDAVGAASGLCAIDHIGLGLAPDQFDTWLLFTKAVLGLAPGEATDLADPYGLIRSSGVSDPHHRVRVVLNVSRGHGTETARRVRAAGRFGASVQSVALTSEDIFGSVAALRARGVTFVPISGNYYDDLAARVPLDSGLVERMRALDIMFDTSGVGRYFHACTESFGDAFFIEIVQRDHYEGYGAVNAQARLASIAQGPQR